MKIKQSQLLMLLAGGIVLFLMGYLGCGLVRMAAPPSISVEDVEQGRLR